MIEYNPETGDMRERKPEVKDKPKVEAKKEEEVMNELVVVDKLAVIVKESGLEQTKAQVLLDKFTGYFQIASDWEKKAKVIVVTDAGQKAEMQMAKTGRLFLREKRIQIERTRKELKEQSLREGKAIDGIANVLKAVIVPIEEYLGQQEKFVEIKAAEIAERARIEMEEKAEKDRLAKEEAERKEQERIRLENVKLKEEAEEKEKELKEEKDRQDKMLANQKEKAEKEKKEIEKNAKKEMADYVRKAKEKEADLERKAMQAEKEREAKREAEKKEREKMATKLREQIECPYCKKKFVLGRKIVKPFDITKSELCPFCSNTDIADDPDKKGWKRCNNCDEAWLAE